MRNLNSILNVFRTLVLWLARRKALFHIKFGHEILVTEKPPSLPGSNYKLNKLNKLGANESNTHNESLWKKLYH